jgi:predicted ATP-dependent serine protease
MLCYYCRAPLSKEPGHLFCPKCKLPNFPNTAEGERPELVRLSESSGTKIARYDVGIFNPIFGGGLAHTSVNLVAGWPGAGKTTMFLMICDILLEQIPQGDMLYIANEQSHEELSDTARRLKIKHMDRILILDAMGGLRRELGAVILETKPKAVVLDSLTNLVGEDMEKAVEFAKTFKEYTVHLKMPALLVNQVNKDGAHAGLEKLQHGVDALFNMDMDETTGQRLLYSTKNRFGPAPVNLNLLMMDEDSERPGYLYLDPEFLEEDEEDE